MKTQTLTLTALTLLAVLLATLWTLPAQAYWPTSIYRNLPVAANDSLNEDGPVVLPYGNGRILVVMRRGFTGPSYQIIDRYGNPVFAIPQSAWPSVYIPLIYEFPMAILDSLGGAIITWHSYSPNYTGIWAQKIDSEGNLLWGSSAVRIYPDEESEYDICPDDHGGFYLAIPRLDITQPHHGIINLQHIDSSGQLLWGEYGVSCPQFNNYHQTRPKLAPDGVGGVYMVWRDGRPPFIFGELYAQRYDSTGHWMWEPPSGIYLDDYAFQHQVHSDGLGGAIPIITGDSWDVLFRLSPQGQILWRRDHVGGESYTSFTLGEPGYFYVSFCYHFQLTPWGFYAIKMDMQGNMCWPHNPGIPLCRQAGWTADNGDIAFYNHQLYAVCNLLRSSTPVQHTFRAQIVNENGRRQFPETGVVLSYSNNVGYGSWEMKTVVPDAHGGLVGVFRESDGNHQDIWGKHMNADGSLGGPVPPCTEEITLKTPVTFEIQGLDVQSAVYVLPQAMPVKLELFNILGARVRVLQDGYLPEGSYTVQIDNRSLPSGIYFLRLQAGDEAMVKKVVMLK